jgi:hypothetical protein
VARTGRKRFFMPIEEQPVSKEMVRGRNELPPMEESSLQ